MEVTNEELDEFCIEHLNWIHSIEAMVNRRLTEQEILALREMTIVYGFDARIAELSTLTQDINEATKNFVEGITQ